MIQLMSIKLEPHPDENVLGKMRKPVILHKIDL